MAPIATAHLLLPLHHELMALLRGLEAADWQRPTVAGAWRVRDVAAHLLDVQLRRLSLQRDGHAGPPPDRDLRDHRALVEWLNELNATWLRGTARVSAPLLVDLLDAVGPQCAAFLQSLDPEGPAIFPVAWAGEETSRHWMDVGRDYTEFWHHQAQIRLAVGAALLEQREWLHPVLALAVHGLRRALAPHRRADGAAVVVQVTGEAGGTWHALAGDGTWTVHPGGAPAPLATVTLPAAVAWPLWFNALSPVEARQRATTAGDETLVQAIFSARSVMV